MDTTLIDRFVNGGPLLRRACEGLSLADLTARPGPGKWSILELVVHLTDMDAISIDRMKRIITEDSPPLLNADEDAYIARLHPAEQSLEDALTLFEVNRRQWGRVLRQLAPEAFSRSGVHSTRGPVTVEAFLVLYSNHLDHHLEFLRQKRVRLGKPLK